MLRTIRKLRAWQVAIFVAVWVLGVSGAFVGYQFVTRTDQGAHNNLQEDQQLYSVAFGDLVNAVSVSGRLVFPNREALAFGVPGTVGEVLIDEGDTVTEGQPLAVLDEESISHLEKAIAQARINMRNAEDALEEARNPYSAAQIAKAESGVANARLDLEKAEEALSELGVVSTDLLAQARIDILQAQVALETAKENKKTLVTPTFQEVMKAQSKVTASHVALQDARDELDALINPTDGDIESVNAAVTKARVDLEAAKEALEALTSVTAVDLAKAQVAVANAQLDLERAQEVVDDATTPATAEDIADYQANIDSAQDSLLTAQFRLQTVERNAEENIWAAMDELDMAQDDYSALFETWLGMNVASPIDQSSDDLLAAHGSDLVTIFEGPHIDRMQLLFEQGILRDEPETPWNEVVVYSWAVLYPGEVLVDCGTLKAGGNRACLRDEFEDAYSVVQDLTASLETLQADEAEKIREAQVSVSQAEYTVAQRREALDDYLTEVAESQSTASEIKSKVEALRLAEVTLDSLKEDLAELTAEPDPLDIEAKRQDVATAEVRLADSLEALASLTGEPDELLLESKNRAIGTAEAELLDAETSLAELMQATEFDIELADREIELAQAKLAGAEEALADLLKDPDPTEVQVKQTAVHVAVESLADAEATLMEYNSVDQLEIDLRQVDVIAARATLDTAKAARERATMLAPWTGVISTIAVEPEQKVEATSSVFEIVDESVVEVQGMVDEIDVLFVREGLPVSVTMDALQGQTLTGTVSHIAAAAGGHQGIAQQGLVSRAPTTTGSVRYAISIRVETHPDLSLLEGLSALASVAIREDRGVLLVPLDSVYGSFDQPVLRVMDNGTIEERPVTLGNRDDFWVVVEGGISEGEEVILEYRDPSESFGGLIGGLQGLLGAQGASIQTIRVDAE